MKSMRRRNRVFMLVIMLLVISIGFAYVNGLLKLNGITNISRQTWDVHFDNIQVTTGSITPVSPATITSGDPTKVTYSVNLDEPGDFYEFTVDAVNDGSIDAMVSDILFDNIAEKKSPYTTITTASIPDHIRYSVKYSDGRDIEEKHKLSAHTSKTYRVRIEFRNDLTAEDLNDIEKVDLTLKFEVLYEQADESAVPVDTIEVELDPNGGTVPETPGWEGSGESATKEIGVGDEYGNLPTPVRSGYEFLGWVGSSEGSEADSYEQLEFIESSGTQYIDVEYVPKMNTKVELDLLLTGSFKPCHDYQGSNILFGVADQNGQWFSANFGELDYQYNEMFVWNDSIGNSEVAKFDIDSSTRTNRNTLILDTDSITYGPHTKSINPKDGNQLTSMYLFGCNSKGYDYDGPFTSYGMRVYGLKIYESDVLVREYVPAINTTTKHTGMYEKLTRRFVGNIGTGEFKAAYTSPSTRVKSKNNHKLIALWREL